MCCRKSMLPGLLLFRISKGIHKESKRSIRRMPCTYPWDDDYPVPCFVVDGFYSACTSLWWSTRPSVSPSHATFPWTSKRCCPASCSSMYCNPSTNLRYGNVGISAIAHRSSAMPSGLSERKQFCGSAWSFCVLNRCPFLQRTWSVSFLTLFKP